MGFGTPHCLPGLGALALKVGVGTVVGVVVAVVVGELLLPAITTRRSEFGSTRLLQLALCLSDSL